VSPLYRRDLANKTLFYLISIMMIFFIGFFILLLYNGIQAKVLSVDPYDNTPDLMIILDAFAYSVWRRHITHRSE